MEIMGAWQQHYKRAGVIDMGIGDISTTLAKAEADAARSGWIVDRVAGDAVLMRRLLEGDWADDFLVLQPGEQLRMTYDDNVIGCART